jgi:hypothetical protein
MDENKENFRDDLTLLAKISDLIESNELFKDENIEINVKLDRNRYNKILRNFREIDWKFDEFKIKIDSVTFNFALKK